MADDSTDSAFGFILFILFLAFLGYAAGGVAGGASGTSGGTAPSLPPLSGTQVGSCPANFIPKQDVPTSSTSPPLNLKVWVDPNHAGTKCATATKSAMVAGTVKVTMAYTADKSQMVSNTGTQTASVKVSGTDDFCVSAVAKLIGINGKVTVKVAIPKVVEQCTMTATAPQPMPVVPPRADDKEDEEGY
jgi:hypothetical protein